MSGSQSKSQQQYTSHEFNVTSHGHSPKPLFYVKSIDYLSGSTIPYDGSSNYFSAIEIFRKYVRNSKFFIF
jgi:hypothetical protein